MKITFGEMPRICLDSVNDAGTGTSSFRAGRDTNTYCRLVQLAVRPGDVVVDLGCGSGRPTILAAERGAEMAVGLDTDSDALLRAQENAKKAGDVGRRVCFVQADMVDFLASESQRSHVLLQCGLTPDRVDLIMSNPPYVPVREVGPKSIDGAADGLRFIRSILMHGSRLANRLAWQQGSYSTPLRMLELLSRTDLVIEAVIAHAASFGEYSLAQLSHLEMLRTQGEAFFWTSRSDDVVTHWYLVMGFVASRRDAGVECDWVSLQKTMRGFLTGLASHGPEYLAQCDLDFPFPVEAAVYQY